MRQEMGVDASAPCRSRTGISSLTFTYLKDDNTIATNREDIRSVQIVIQASSTASSTAITMMDQIRLRTR